MPVHKCLMETGESSHRAAASPVVMISENLYFILSPQINKECGQRNDKKRPIYTNT